MTEEFDNYRIRSPAWDRHYWSNTDGWVDRESSDLFSSEEKDRLKLPMYGEWIGLLYTSQYHCSECQNSWEDTWTCACNDRCGVCNTETEPESYVEYDADQNL